MATFLLWSLFKVAKTDAYLEIHREERGWGGSTPLPKIAVANDFRIRSNYTIVVKQTTIQDGDIKTKKSSRVTTRECDMKIGSSSKSGFFRNMTCLPESLNVTGIFGDTLYQYVAVEFYLMEGLNFTDGSISLVVEDRPTMYATVLFSHYYTFMASHWTGVEIFFKKIRAIKGESLGLFGHTGNDELEEVLPTLEYLKYSHEYSRFSTAEEYVHVGEAPDGKHRRVFTFYLRAYLTETEEFYEVYSIIKLLEKAGGLWTSLALVFSTSLWLCFSVHRRLARLIRQPEFSEASPRTACSQICSTQNCNTNSSETSCP
jgi:hypothetical protein